MPIGIRVTDLPAAAGTLDDDDEFLALEDGSLRRAIRTQAGPKAAIVQVADTANQFTGTNVETVLAEIQANVDALVISGGGIAVASEAEALAGTDNTKAMTPARDRAARRLVADAGLYDAYVDKADGTAATADSGQTWSHFAPAAAQELRIVNERLTYGTVASGGVAGYMETVQASPVTRMGCEFTFVTAGTPGPAENGGVVGLIPWKQARGSIDGTTIEDTNFHFITGHLGWSVGYWASNVYTVTHQGNYDTPLDRSDPDRIYRLEWVLDGDTATVHLPDGSVETLTHAQFGTTPGTFAGFEVYANDVATAPRLGFVSVWADAAATKPAGRRSALDSHRLLPILAGLTEYSYYPVVVHRSPTPAANVAVPTGGFAAVHADLTVTFVVPPSGKFLVEWSGYLTGAAAVRVLWALYDSVGSSMANASVLSGAYVGAVTHRRLLSGYAPDTEITAHWRHLATGAGATMNLDHANGYNAVLSVTPIA